MKQDVERNWGNKYELKLRKCSKDLKFIKGMK